MARPVLLILLLLAGLWWLSRQGLRNARPTPSAPAARQRDQEAPGTAQPIEQCAVCGVHAPRTGLVALSGGRYCCAEHADQAGRGGA
ncbi:hypothetical protein B7R78_0001700 [Ralstonia solanacearum]|uniref:Uncharacterized protein n=1 Tax=Ralstonia solanacearum K60 TaxID=1091042 RepID=A0AAP7ZNR2_RALSL|nr:PP0621 family protein [Ralstonia solanacearum]MBT1535904.1 hypothetical protein [Ralstonia solanacearum]OYQ13946.1 hypothetical protein B7R77_12275 [Ralstonia solanacearum K60]QOK81330.1 hypothetical protein HF906_03660 [Ralstonia solanacearum]RIJ86254.1 hypothetical protein RSP822_11200 [Ralstonia solanacearum]CCF98272.1 conserved exported hypothetical protein [Ralstonia solanacearum K60]